MSMVGEEDGTMMGSGDCCGWTVSGLSGRREGLLLRSLSRGVRTSCLSSEDVLGLGSEVEMERFFLERWLLE